MPPKKLNAFACFMMDMRKKFEAEGRRYKNLGELTPVCTPLWNAMSPEEKAFYNQKSKSVEVKQEKCDSRRVPISLKEREAEAKQEKKAKALQQVEDMINDHAEHGTIVEGIFHLGHFNYAVETDEKYYPPCEIGIVKYSLLSGIKAHYHEFINPGPIPTGYSYEAKVHSEGTHLIPSLGFQLYNSNYVSITNAIKEILGTCEGVVAPLFVLDEDILKVEYMLQWLINKSVEKDASYPSNNPFKVLSINKLFYELGRHADLDNPRLKFTSTAQCGAKLTKGTFYHCPNMACQWHEDKDRTKYCSLTQVRSYAYEMSDFCCEHYDLRLLPNRHVPSDIADETRYEVQPKIPKLSNEGAKPVVNNGAVRVENTLEEPRKPYVHAGSIGSGRGLLGSSVGTATPLPGSTSSQSTPAGRGRGRGLLAHQFDDDSD